MKNDQILVRAIQKLYEWQYLQREENDFTHQLYSSFQKANELEFEKLEISFPYEAQAYRLWLKTEDPVDFFSRFGVLKGPRP